MAEPVREDAASSRVRAVVDALAADWQAALGEAVTVVIGGSVVSGLFVFEGAESIDVDARFLVEDPTAPYWRERVEAATGLHYRKTIEVSDWPEGRSAAQMIEGRIAVPELALPLEVEGCLRNRRYVGWARLYPEVYSPEELTEIRARKAALVHDRDAYKAFKAQVRDECERRALAGGLVSPDRSPYL